MKNFSKSAKVLILLFGTVVVAMIVLSQLEVEQRSIVFCRPIMESIYRLLGRPSGTNKISKCVDTLRRIQVYKDEWAGENRKSPNDIPTWNDLRPYFEFEWPHGIPPCPKGGSYNLNPVGKVPTCSIGGRGHSIN
jgi:hypothetical protein